MADGSYEQGQPVEQPTAGALGAAQIDPSQRKSVRRRKVLIAALVIVALLGLMAAVTYRPLYRSVRRAVADCVEWGNSANISEEHLAQLWGDDSKLLQEAESLAGQADSLGQQQLKKAQTLLKRQPQNTSPAQQERVANCQPQRPLWSLRRQAQTSKDTTLEAIQQIQELSKTFSPIEGAVLDRNPQATAVSRGRLDALLPGMDALFEDSKGDVDKEVVREDLLKSIQEAKLLLSREPTQVLRHEFEVVRLGLYQAADMVVQSQNRKASIDCSHQNCMALTFDDGPSPVSLDILSVLQEKHAIASFFSIGQQIDTNGKDILTEIGQRGFPVGSHTWSHADFTSITAQQSQRKEFVETATAIRSATGRPVNLVRPPHGAVNEESRTNLSDQLGAGIALYNVDSYDWSAQASTLSVQEKVLSQARPGAIILMHDAYQHTVDALPQIIDQLRDSNDNLRFVTIPQLTGEYPRAGDIYYSRTNILRM
ncbi:hypothetical protein KIMH_07790 [Bombiscardovia apis]|uniref:NodB homology domain-containing protein n=1 Tax=Bombiscardovia apis TaxID=2932182 RepID=A0ABM8BCM9_9BIFI|nr:polysaccharide deacetylase family protein [Bombiscardovia apis]BDR54668.1 hypothetical protein KIMH_07790 [Bombiscardovia apis]